MHLFGTIVLLCLTTLVFPATASIPAEVDVAVIGSGVSGLSAAFRLRKEHPNANIHVFEALDTPGGRTKSIQVGKDKDWASVGGTWLFPSDLNALALAKEAGCFPSVDPYFIRPHVAPIQAILHSILFVELWTLGREIANQPKGQWWLHPKAKDLDAITLDKWLRDRWALESDRDSLRQYFFAMETMQSTNLSTLHAAVMIYHRFPFFKPSEGTLNNSLLANPLIFRRWENGTGEFVNCLVRHIGEDVVHLNSPIREIVRADVNITLITGNNERIIAKYVITAVSPTAALNTMRHTPPLPEAVQSLSHSLMTSQYPSIGVILVYSNPWWRAYKTSGMILPDLIKDLNYFESGVFGPVVELTSLNKTASKDPNVHGILRILTWPARLVGFKNEEEVVQNACEYIAGFYPKEARGKALAPIAYNIFDWQERQPFVPGVTYQFGTGALTTWNKNGHDALRDPIGRLYWAGTERGTVGLNWMEGGVERGEVAAKAIAALL